MLTHIGHFPGGDHALSAKTVLGEQPYIHPTAMVHDSHLGSWTEIGPYCHVSETRFDDYSYLADNVIMIYTEVGKFCSIASHVRINPGNHPMERVTQHHMTYRRALFGFGEDDPTFFDWRRSNTCRLGHDVWLGHGVTVMPGVSIGTGAVVGAGAVVTKDIAPYDIAVGIPARPVRQRFSDTVIAKLLAIAWWDWERPMLAERFDDLMNVEAFVEKYG